MDNSHLNEFLAVEVMGWNLAPHPFDGVLEIYNDNDKHIMQITRWNPCENIEQAMMCAEQIHGEIYFMRHLDGRWTSSVQDHSALSESESLPEAISLACARAKGWKDE